MLIRKVPAIGDVNIYKKHSKSSHGDCGRIRIGCKESSKKSLYEEKAELENTMNTTNADHLHFIECFCNLGCFQFIKCVR